MLVKSPDQLKDLQDLVLSSEIIVVDTETNGLDAWSGDRVIGIAFYFPSHDKSFYLPVIVERPPNPTLFYSMNEEEANINLDVSGFIDAWNRAEFTAVYFNALFDMHMMAESMRMRPPKNIEDVMLASHLYNENEKLSNGTGDPQNTGYAPKTKGAYTLKRLGVKYIGKSVSEAEDALERTAQDLGLDPKKDIRDLPLGVVAEYAEQDVRLTWSLRDFYLKHFYTSDVKKLYYKRNSFLRYVLYEMEKNGIKVDEKTIHEHIKNLQEDQSNLESVLSHMASEADIRPVGGFNPRSPKQCKAVLIRRGVNVDSTSAITLESLPEKDDFVESLLEYRAKVKAERTYYLPYLQLKDKNDHIHPSFNPIGTVAGRISCYRPNLQQIPRAGSYEVKKVFISDSPDKVLMEVDHSMLEIRLASHVANERTMKRMLNGGSDIHQYTADNLNVNRYLGKTANFSFLYGMGPVTGAQRLKMDENDARNIIEQWHRLFPGFRRAYKYYSDKAATMRSLGSTEMMYVTQANGRIRRYDEYLDYPYWYNRKEKSSPPYHTAFNTIVQGYAAHVLEEGLTRMGMDEELMDMIDLRITVHDSVIFSIRERNIDNAMPAITRMMTDFEEVSVPLVVEAKVGNNLYDMRDV